MHTRSLLTQSAKLDGLVRVGLRKIWPCTGVRLNSTSKLYEEQLSVLTMSGYKFETLSLLEKPWSEVSRDQIEGRENEVVDNYAQYCSICKTGIGSTTMIIGGEVDGGKLSPIQSLHQP